MNTRNTSPSKEISFIDLLSIIWHTKKVIITITSIFILLGLVYILIVPRWYQAKVTILPSNNNLTLN